MTRLSGHEWDALELRRRRDAARKGWARRRREGYVPKGRAQPHARTRQQGLSMAYPARQPKRAQLIAAYLEHTGGNMGGAETFAEIVVQDWKVQRAAGVHAATTHPRRARGLELAGRGRCERTVRRHRKIAVELGLASYRRVRRRHNGLHRDYLRLEMHTLMSVCLRQRERPTAALPLSTISTPGNPRAPGESIAPASPADTNSRPRGPANGSDQEGASEACSQLRFAELEQLLEASGASSLEDALRDQEAEP